MPADLAAVQADDALLDMIGAGHASSDADDELTRVLAAWRQEVHAEPVPELVDTRTALATIRSAARRPARRRNPVFGSAAAAAAVFVIAFSAVGLVAKSAQPGDHLWGVTQVLYSDYARSVETAAAVRTELNEANTALKQHNPERARAALQRVQQQLPVIGESEGHTDLTARHRQLEQRLLTGAPDSGTAKLPGDPAFPSSVPAGAEPKDGDAPQSGPQSTPTPGSANNPTPGTPTPDPSQFMPERPPYPSPGVRPYSPQDGSSSGTGQGSHTDGDGSNGGSSTGTEGGTGADTPAPSPTPDDHVNGTPPPSPESKFHRFCPHPSPQPPYCG